jgi:phenylalanyl-tRNA synthetase beta chain
MQFSESWLRSFCNPPLNTEQLCHALTMAGLEVEETRPAAPPFSGIIVGEIKSITKHPNADKLNVCEVDVGDGALKQIVCGAPNVRVGMRIPAAQIGAKLPPGEDGKPFEIGKAKMRGVESFGMLCSARELGISADASGLLDLGGAAKIGQNVRETLSLDDTIITVKLTPNKADCLSVYGVAREVAAITGAPLVTHAKVQIPAAQNRVLSAQIVAKDLCGRFSGRTILGVNAKAATPEWMKRRLESAGQRSISALVDISNYVMLELGRPSHVFDLDKVHGGLVVRWAKAGETLKLLNGNTVTIDEKVGVICDDHGVESLAGIMGGDSTSVNLEATQNVYVEAAFWWPEAIQGRARRFNFSTDAGHRFERGVDYSTTVEHLEVLTKYITEICGGAAGPVDDTIANLPVRKPVTLRVARAQKVIGLPISSDEMQTIFKRLSFTYSATADSITVTPPSYRFDIEIEEDLIEEVARIYGFEKIPALPPKAPAVMRTRLEASRSQHFFRARLAASEYHEVVTYSFVEEAWEQNFAGNTNPIKLLNPIASQMGVMRSTLIGGLIGTLKYNLAHKAPRVRLFEVGKVFSRDPSIKDGELAVQGVAQPIRIGGLAYGNVDAEQWGTVKRAVDFYDVKTDIDALIAPLTASYTPVSDHPAFHPGRCAKIMIGGEVAGYMGELHPKWMQEYDLPHAPILFEIFMRNIEKMPLSAPQVPSKMPVVRRDIALVVDQNVSVDSLLATLNAAKSELVRAVSVFDVYVGAGLPQGKKSLAFQVLMQDTSVTLTDEIADKSVATLVAAAQATHQATLRT